MRCVAGAFAVLDAVAGAMGQGYNVDFGSMFDQKTPSDEYGAGAGQPGFWNNLPGFDFMPIALADVTGRVDGVTVLDAGGNAPFGFPNGGTIGDDGALMDDALDLGAASEDVFVIEGLAPGAYEVYTYAWAPDSPTFLTGVSVNEQAMDIIGGDWPGTQVRGVTYALHEVEIEAGVPIEIATSTVVGFATLNGFQIKPLARACVADCNDDGALNILDFVCFQAAWQAQAELGDCDGNGVYDILDFVCFQGLFQAGCP
jgi:hypothetical protein